MLFIFALAWYLIGCWVLLMMIKSENKRCPNNTLPFSQALVISLFSWFGILIVLVVKIMVSLSITKQIQKFIDDFES